MDWRRRGGNALKEVWRAYRDTKPVRRPAKHEVLEEMLKGTTAALEESPGPREELPSPREEEAPSFREETPR